MSYIVLSADQISLLGKEYPVQVRDPQGNVLGHIEPLGFTAEEIAEARRQAALGPLYSSEEVQRHLQLLEQKLAEEGAMDQQRMSEILEEARSRTQP
jgi:hypothetical protein